MTPSVACTRMGPRLSLRSRHHGQHLPPSHLPPLHAFDSAFTSVFLASTFTLLTPSKQLGGQSGEQQGGQSGEQPGGQVGSWQQSEKKQLVGQTSEQPGGHVGSRQQSRTVVVRVLA